MPSLSAAARRDDGAIELAPNCKGSASHKVVGKLLREGSIEEISARGALPFGAAMRTREHSRCASPGAALRPSGSPRAAHCWAARGDPARDKPVRRAATARRKKTRNEALRLSAKPSRGALTQTGCDDRDHHVGNREAKSPLPKVSPSAMSAASCRSRFFPRRSFRRSPTAPLPRAYPSHASPGPCPLLDRTRANARPRLRQAPTKRSDETAVSAARPHKPVVARAQARGRARQTESMQTGATPRSNGALIRASKSPQLRHHQGRDDHKSARISPGSSVTACPEQGFARLPFHATA
jgi:hypothetical protein